MSPAVEAELVPTEAIEEKSELTQAKEIIVPAFIKQNHNQVTVDFFKERVSDINQEIFNTGLSLIMISKHLSAIRKQLKDKKENSWKAFIKSDCISLSAKSCTDLAESWDKWLSHSEISEELIAPLSIRSFNAMANASSEARERVYNRLENGDDMTEKEVRATLNPSKKKVAPSTKVEKKLAKDATPEEVATFWKSKFDSSFTKEQTTANKLKAKEERIKSLVAEVAQLKEEMSNRDKLKIVA